MGKTEMMKRYEAETGKSARDELYSGSIKLYMPTNDYIAWLEAQLAWRPTIEKPEEGKFVFGYNKKTKCFDILFFYNDEFYLNGIAVSTTHWLPMPPAPEGE